MASQSLATRLDQLERENQRLRRAVEELSILNDIATTISSTQSLAQIVESIVDKCIKHLQAEQGSVVLLREEEKNSMFETMVRKMDSASDVIPFRLGDHITGWMLTNQRPLLVNDLQNDARFKLFLPQDHPVRSLLSVPLRQKGKIIGLVNVFNKQTQEGFSEDDQRLLSIIASQSAQVIESARLYEQEKALHHVQEEIRLAKDIQMNLLPKESPGIPGYEVAGRTVPAQNVGGDYFDFIQVNDTQWCVCLGDVSGKGLPAALLMANLQATIRGQVLSDCSPASCMCRSNALLYRSTDDRKFATLFYGILDAGDHSLFYSNAGHNPPYLLSPGGSTQTLFTGGVILGVLDSYEYEQERVRLLPGDVTLLFSDGITEATNPFGQEFGEERLLELVRGNLGQPASVLADTVFDAVQRHAAASPQADDMTVVVIRRTAG